jgi:hypothetical protein
MLERAEPLRQRRTGGKTEHILSTIAESKSASTDYIRAELSKLVTPDYVEKRIRERYEDKKEAQQLAGSYLTDHIQNKLNSFLAERAQELVPEIDDILADYQAAGTADGQMELGSLTVPFNAQGVFLGALAAAGTAGALATWAAVATAGSNLGAYLLIPSIVSFLSGLGISVGGATSAVSLVAAFGGPITIMIGLAALAAIAIYALFGSSWQSRLAKKLCETLEDQHFLDMLTKHSEKYWDDTRHAFQKGMTVMEAAFQENLNNLRKLVNATSREEMTSMIAHVGATRDFFGGIPWRQGK